MNKTEPNPSSGEINIKVKDQVNRLNNISIRIPVSYALS